MELLFKEPSLEKEFEKLNHSLRRVVAVFRGLVWAWFSGETLITGVSIYTGEIDENIGDVVKISANDLTYETALDVKDAIYRLFHERMDLLVTLHWDYQLVDSFFTLILPYR